MSQELGQQDGAVSSKTGHKGEEPVGWERQEGALTQVRGRQAAGGNQVLEAEALQALSTQTVTEALRFTRRAHKDV